ncbi:MAG: glycosyltransferase family 4 protein [Alphaproteobacteria bacterium]|nr:glycosyltransferase family 4 protein [Alphaproteobacteria bacterium]
MSALVCESLFEARSQIPRTAERKHILVVGGLAASLTNFRGSLIQAMLAAGHRVTAAAGDNDAQVAWTLRGWGAEFEHVELARAGMNPVADIAALGRLVSLMRRTAPDVFLGYTIKPVTYGLIASRIAGVRQRFAMITGLGYAFTDGDEFRRRLARFAAKAAYALALRYADKVIFQNPDDEAHFLELGLLRNKYQSARVNGSGVDLMHFRPAALQGGPVTFLMIARLLRDKGLYDYVDAARITKKVHPDVKFVLVGPFDPNPAAVKSDEVKAWVSEGIIEYRGAVQDVRPEIAACHVLVLPSYREGTPRTVLEAMAMGRAIITTDVPGCRQTVENGVNGLLVEARSSTALAKAMSVFAVRPDLISSAGSASRQRAALLFDSSAVSRDVMELLGLRAATA